MKREDLVVGKIYRIAGRGPMRLMDRPEDGNCLFHTPLGNNYYAAVEEDIRPADAAYVRTHAQELKVALGVQKEPEVLLRWAAEIDGQAAPKTAGVTMLHCPECNNPLQYQSGRVSFRHNQDAGVFVDSAGKIDAYNWRVHGPGVVVGATLMCPACGYGTDLKQGQLLANCDVVIEERKNG